MKFGVVGGDGGSSLNGVRQPFFFYLRQPASFAWWPCDTECSGERVKHCITNKLRLSRNEQSKQQSSERASHFSSSTSFFTARKRSTGQGKSPEVQRHNLHLQQREPWPKYNTVKPPITYDHLQPKTTRKITSTINHASKSCNPTEYNLRKNGAIDIREHHHHIESISKAAPGSNNRILFVDVAVSATFFVLQGVWPYRVCN